MSINELIKKLEEIAEVYGDVSVYLCAQNSLYTPGINVNFSETHPEGALIIR